MFSQTSYPHDHRLCDLLTPLTKVAVEYLHTSLGSRNEEIPHHDHLALELLQTIN